MHGANTGLRYSVGKQSSVVTTAIQGRASAGNHSEFSENKMGLGKLSQQGKLPDHHQASVNKSSKGKDDDDTNSAHSSRSGSESEESQVFVRTKAAPQHHESSTDD